MWYAFYPSAVTTDADFTQQMGALTRAIGDRGKRRVSEAVPPAPTHPARAPEPAAAAAAAAAPAPVPVPSVASGATTSSFAELSAFFREERERAEAREARLEAKLEQLMEEARPQIQTAKDAISDERLDALQARMQTLREGQLLTDTQVYAAEDATADCIGAMLSPGTTIAHPAVDKVHKMISLCQRMKADGAFARQLCRGLGIE